MERFFEDDQPEFETDKVPNPILKTIFMNNIGYSVYTALRYTNSEKLVIPEFIWNPVYISQEISVLNEMCRKYTGLEWGGNLNKPLYVKIANTPNALPTLKKFLEESMWNHNRILEMVGDIYASMRCYSVKQHGFTEEIKNEIEAHLRNLTGGKLNFLVKFANASEFENRVLDWSLKGGVLESALKHPYLKAHPYLDFPRNKRPPEFLEWCRECTSFGLKFYEGDFPCFIPEDNDLFIYFLESFSGEEGAMFIKCLEKDLICIRKNNLFSRFKKIYVNAVKILKKNYKIKNLKKIIYKKTLP